MINTQKVTAILKAAGLVAEKSDRSYTRPGYHVRKIDSYSVGVLFDSLGENGHFTSIKAEGALRAAGLSVEIKEDQQTFVVREALR